MPFESRLNREEGVLSRDFADSPNQESGRFAERTACRRLPIERISMKRQNDGGYYPADSV